MQAIGYVRSSGRRWETTVRRCQPLPSWSFSGHRRSPAHQPFN